MRSSLLKIEHRRQEGLSLIEMMVALALGLIIVAALAELFVNISRTNQEMAKTNSQIENARFGMQFLRGEVVHAGFWGMHVPEFDNISLGLDVVPEDTPQDVPDPCLDYASWSQAHVDQLIGISVQVHDDVPGTCASAIQGKVEDTDILIVRHANTCEPGVGYCDDSGGAGQLYFRVSLCNSDPMNNDFPITDRPYKLDNAYDPNEPVRDRACTSPAPRRKFVQSIFYIRRYSETDGDGIYTLVRSQYEFDGTDLKQQDPVPLVEGIENMRVEVGIDSLSEPYIGEDDGTAADPNEAIDWLNDKYWDTPTNRGDGIPDGDFEHCGSGCNSGQLVNVAAVKLYLLARANEASPGYTDSKTYTLGGADPVGPFNDSFKRHVFSTTVRLNNVSARRETP